MAVAEFLALYRGRSIADAELVALSADQRVVALFFEELIAKPAEADGGRNPRGQIGSLKHGERED